MPAGAPKGNKNAEIWDLEKSKKLFEKAIDLTNNEIIFYLRQGDKAIEVSGYEYDFIGEIARKLNTFHEIFNHLVKRFPELQSLKNQLDNNIESNCYSNTKKGIIREATGIVNLKSNWKWTDRSNTTLDGGLNIFNNPEYKQKAEDRLNKADDSE